jgi:hypothetical protein
LRFSISAVRVGDLGHFLLTIIMFGGAFPGAPSGPGRYGHAPSTRHKASPAIQHSAGPTPFLALGGSGLDLELGEFRHPFLAPLQHLAGPGRSPSTLLVSRCGTRRTGPDAPLRSRPDRPRVAGAATATYRLGSATSERKKTAHNRSTMARWSMPRVLQLPSTEEEQL